MQADIVRKHVIKCYQTQYLESDLLSRLEETVEIDQCAPAGCVSSRLIDLGRLVPAISSEGNAAPSLRDTKVVILLVEYNQDHAVERIGSNVLLAPKQGVFEPGRMAPSQPRLSAPSVAHAWHAQSGPNVSLSLPTMSQATAALRRRLHAGVLNERWSRYKSRRLPRGKHLYASFSHQKIYCLIQNVLYYP